MKIKFPKISQSNFDYAIKCIQVCRQEDAKEYGFNYPYFTPGGMYGKQWWQLDSSLALGGYKWVDRDFCKRSLLNFIESQKEDGRICLWGGDSLPNVVAGGNKLTQTEGVSSLPKLFDIAYHLVKDSIELELKTKTYAMLKKYLNWWLKNRQDRKTGLITAVFEETFIPYLGASYEYAPIDTNVEIYVGIEYVKLLAVSLGELDFAKELEEKQALLKESINKYLWCEEKGAYFAYFVKEDRLDDRLMASTFFPLRLRIADEDKKERLIKLLTSKEHFNWDNIPLTSVSMKDKIFTTTKGDYVGNDSWSGNVWTLINEMVVRGLLDSGEKDLGVELALKTIYAFNDNYTEFINPFDGSGHGVKEYAWTASQYLTLIIECIFGISYNESMDEVKAEPNLNEELKGEFLELNDITLSKGKLLNIVINKGVTTLTKK